VNDSLWSVVGVAAAVASAAAAVVSTAIVLWLRYRDRPSADWLVEPLTLAEGNASRALFAQTGRGKPSESITITNVGDGSAFRVEVTGFGCKVMGFIHDESDKRGYRTPSTLARVTPSESFGIFIWHDDIKKREESRVVVNWLEAPTRHKKTRRESIPVAAVLRDIQDTFERDFPR
jgi:hypothetical protein